MSKERGAFWYDRLKNFFQRLSQAVEASQHSALVVSLLATDPALSDDLGKDILAACNQGLNRMAAVQSPVEKGDLAELCGGGCLKSFQRIQRTGSLTSLHFGTA